MEVNVHDDIKLVEIWLTKQEQEDAALREQLQRMYQVYKSRSYMVAQFHSGAGSLYDATRDLLLFNRKRIAEIENRREKSLENPNFSASYSGSFPIQC